MCLTNLVQCTGSLNPKHVMFQLSVYQEYKGFVARPDMTMTCFAINSMLDHTVNQRVIRATDDLFLQSKLYKNENLISFFQRSYFQAAHRGADFLKLR